MMRRTQPWIHSLTGIMTSLACLSSNSLAASPTIYGRDDRVAVGGTHSPYTHAVELKIEKNNRRAGRCSGTMLNEFWAITASHCLKQFSSIQGTVRDSNGKFVTSKVTRIEWASDLIGGEYQGAQGNTYNLFGSDLDWVLIRFEKPMVKPGTGIPIADTNQLPTQFPFLVQKLGFSTGFLTAHWDCSVHAIEKGVEKNGSTLTYDCDMGPGDSGGPILMKTEYDQYSLIGVISSQTGAPEMHKDAHGAWIAEYYKSGWSNRAANITGYADEIRRVISR